MPEITVKDLNGLKKKIAAILDQINSLEEKLAESKSSKNYRQMIILGVIDGKNTTQKIHGQRIGVTPCNEAANALHKRGFLKITDPKKKKITSKVPFDINFNTILNRMFAENQSHGSTLIIENFYQWFEKKLKLDKESCDKILKFMRNRNYVDLKGGDPIGYSGRFYTNETGVKYYYVIKRKDKSAFNN